MANNAGRQGAGANAQLNEHVEFTVKVRFSMESILLIYYLAMIHTFRARTALKNYRVCSYC